MAIKYLQKTIENKWDLVDAKTGEILEMNVNPSHHKAIESYEKACNSEKTKDNGKVDTCRSEIQPRLVSNKDNSKQYKLF